MSEHTTGPLQGRRILVTGASKGIGAAIARAVHRDGAEVAVHFNSDRTGAEALASELGDRVHLVHGDLSAREAATQVWSAASSAMGGVDTLVNNAGAWIASPLEAEDARADGNEAWAEGWDANMQLNLLSAADLCREALLTFREQGEGAVINMTSRSAHRGDDAEHLAYGAAKAGLLSLTKGIARGYGHLGVCVPMRSHRAGSIPDWRPEPYRTKCWRGCPCAKSPRRKMWPNSSRSSPRAGLAT